MPPLLRVIDDIGTFFNLASGWAQLMLSKPSDPLECARCRRPFKDGFDITKNLAAHLNANVYCQKCYDPYLKYLDDLEDEAVKEEPLPIETFIKNRDVDDRQRAEQEISESFASRTSSTLIIVASTLPNTFDDTLSTTDEKGKQSPSNPCAKQPAVAPFVHIGDGFLAAAQVGTLVATGATLDPGDREKPSSSSPSTSTALRVPSRKTSPNRSRPPSPSPRGIAPLRHIGATLLRAGKLAQASTHITVRAQTPTPSSSPPVSRYSTPPRVPSPRPSSPAPSGMSEATLLSARPASPAPTNDSQTIL